MNGKTGQSYMLMTTRHKNGHSLPQTIRTVTSHLSYTTTNCRILYISVIDGGLIEYGLEDYVGDGQTRGRCDCMIFSDSHLILIEFKMDMNPETSDKGRWRNFSQGMAQIKDFYLYLKDRFAETQEDLQTFYPETNIIPTVCMKYEPESHPKRNVQRNNEKEKFRMATKLKIRIFHQYSFE